MLSIINSTLNSILIFFQLKNEVKQQQPEVIGCYLEKSESFNIPYEIRKKLSSTRLSEVQSLQTITLAIDNHTDYLKGDIIIQYKDKLDFKPILYYKNRTISVPFNINKSKKEIIITELPPHEVVYIDLTNIEDFNIIEHVLVGGKIITEKMQKLAYYKRNPEMLKMKSGTNKIMVFAFSVILFAIISGVYVVKKIATHSKDQNIIDNAFLNINGESCSPYMYENIVGSEKVLERKFKQLGEYWGNFILQHNEVYNLEDLLIKDKIVLCNRKILKKK